MTFNRIISLLFIIAVLFSSCENKNQFTVSGKITHAEGDTIRLDQLLVSTKRPVAKVKIDKNGEFKFNGETSIPTFYLLSLKNQVIPLLIDSLENIRIEADAANFSRDFSVEGSHGSALVKELIDHLNFTEHKIDSIESLKRLYKGNPDYEQLKPKWDDEIKNILDKQTEFSNNFVMKHPFSMASVYAIYQKYRKDGSYVIRDLQTMRTAASALNTMYPESDHVKALYRNTLQLIKKERAAKVQKYIQENGSNSPEIVLPDQNGKEIALSSLRGKVVLVQFWAAQDRTSRIVNEALVEAYKKYKNKGFEIYQVSVDNNRIEWVDAIDKDKLTWINVGDMEGSIHAVNVYNVKQIPYNYLLDRNGVIVAKNITGPALDKTLKNILSK